MWQTYALGAVLTAAAESVFDKAAVVKNVQIDGLVASFWRPFLYTLLTILIGLTGVLGSLTFFFHWSLFVMAIFGACTSLFYTYLLKRVELTNIASVAYLAPIVLLFIDTHIAGAALAGSQMVGIMLLVLGGIGFALDGRSFRFKKELTWSVWGIFLFNLTYGWADAYLFKYLNEAHGVNGVSFFSSLWLLCSLYMLLLLLWQRKLHLMVNRTARVFITQAAAGKSFDAVNSVLWAQALTLAAVSQVSAFDATYPLILFLLIVVVQGLFKVPLGERIDSERAWWKVGATVLLVAGGYLAS